MDKKELKVGSIYYIKHAGGVVRAKYVGSRESGFKRKMTHFLFLKLSTDREVELKSTQKIVREVCVVGGSNVKQDS